MFKIVTVICIAAMLHSASACSCLPPTEDRMICDAKFIARVFITSVTPSYNQNFGANDYSYGNVVLEAYKGRMDANSLKLTSRGGNSAACGMEPFAKGTEMIVVGSYDERTNTVSLSLCSFYKEFSLEMFQLHQKIKIIDCSKVPKSEFSSN